jgi:hypothetical protein
VERAPFFFFFFFKENFISFSSFTAIASDRQNWFSRFAFCRRAQMVLPPALRISTKYGVYPGTTGINTKTVSDTTTTITVVTAGEIYRLAVKVTPVHRWGFRNS